MTFDDFIRYCDIDPEKMLLSYKLSCDSSFELEWKRKHADWAQYVANMEVGDNWPDIKKWCESNLIGQVDLSTPVYFELEEDLILFALRWG